MRCHREETFRCLSGYSSVLNLVLFRTSCRDRSTFFILWVQTSGITLFEFYVHSLIISNSSEFFSDKFMCKVKVMGSCEAIFYNTRSAPATRVSWDDDCSLCRLGNGWRMTCHNQALFIILNLQNSLSCFYYNIVSVTLINWARWSIRYRDVNIISVKSFEDNLHRYEPCRDVNIISVRVLKIISIDMNHATFKM